MTSKKPYLPNNWKKYKDLPAEHFKSVTFQDFHDWKLCAWELPESVCCLIRVERMDTGKVKEYAYQKGSAATKKLNQLIQDPNNEITICDDDEIHLIRYEEMPFDGVDTDDD